MQMAARQAEHWDQRTGGETRLEAGSRLKQCGHCDCSTALGSVRPKHGRRGWRQSPLAGAVLERDFRPSVLDVSRVGLRAAHRRPGAAAEKVQWLVGDVRTWRPSRRYAVRHDRALFHCRRPTKIVMPICELSMRPPAPCALSSSLQHCADGPLRCSGFQLPFSTADLAAALGTRWQMINESRELHTAPSGTIQPFMWTAFVARPGQASHATLRLRLA